MEDTIIIGMSGKKQSGKTLSCEDIQRKYGLSQSANYPVTTISATVALYSFADMLKQKVCMDTMGLTYEQCNGTNEQKSTPTKYKWENLPRQIRYDNKLGSKYASNGEVYQHILPEGFMTAREILQIVGTDIFRKYFDDDIWVNATFRKIEKEKPKVAIITDARFPGEIDAIMNNGGCVIRLLRDVCESDFHESETALDDYDFTKWGNRVCIIDNQHMSIEEKNVVVFKYLEGIIKCQ